MRPPSRRQRDTRDSGTERALTATIADRVGRQKPFEPPRKAADPGHDHITPTRPQLPLTTVQLRDDQPIGRHGYGPWASLTSPAPDATVVRRHMTAMTEPDT